MYLTRNCRATEAQGWCHITSSGGRNLLNQYAANHGERRMLTVSSNSDGERMSVHRAKSGTWQRWGEINYCQPPNCPKRLDRKHLTLGA